MSSLDNHTDQQLLKAIAENDEKAFTELVRRFWKKCHSNAYARVHSHEVAKEIVQDVFMSVWDKRKNSTISNLSSYLYACVRNKCFNHIESRIQQQKYWEHYRNFLTEGTQTTNAAEYSSLVDAIEEGLSHLPSKSVEVFKLSRMEGRTIPEIASSLNLSEKAIEYHLSKSLKLLRIHLKDFILAGLIAFPYGASTFI